MESARNSWTLNCPIGPKQPKWFHRRTLKEGFCSQLLFYQLVPHFFMNHSFKGTIHIGPTQILRDLWPSPFVGNFYNCLSAKEYLPNLLESALLCQIFVFWVRDFKFWLHAYFLIFFNCAKFQKHWTTFILDIIQGSPPLNFW